jgi:hypothetical protein
MSLVTWFLVIAGWVVVHRKTLDRERRKEKREITDAAVKKLAVLEADAIGFHRADEFDEDRREILQWETARIIRSLGRSPLSELGIAPVLLKNLRQSITLENFDRRDFSPQPAHGKIVYDIRSAVDELISKIEEKKMKVWP